jgi:tetratricopeptide (TPR) repeat protein
MINLLLAMQSLLAPVPASASNLEQGIAALDKNDINKALACFAAHIRSNPNDAAGYCWRGKVHLLQSRRQEAIADCSRAIEINPRFAEAYSLRGDLFYSSLQFAKAEKEYTTAIRLEPKNADYWNQRGTARMTMNQDAEAIRDFSQALELDPQRAWMYSSNRAECHFSARNYRLAAADYTIALKHDDPKHLDSRSRAWFLYKRGLAYLECGQPREASVDFTAAIDRDSDNAAACYHKRGLCYFRMREFARAKADFGEAIGKGYDYPALSWYHRGMSEARLAEYGKARTDFLRAMKQDPAEASGYEGLAWLLATCPENSVRNGPKAIPLAWRACELSRWARRSCLEALAAAYAECGDFRKAVKVQRTAITCEPENKESLDLARQRLARYLAGQPYRER